MGTISLQTLKPLLLKGTWEEKRVYNGPKNAHVEIWAGAEEPTEEMKKAGH